MKYIITAICLLYGIASHAGSIVLNGVYQGKNLYVMNPFAPVGDGFCVSGVTVNGSPVTDNINSSAFEIDLSVYNLKKGDAVEVVISHTDGCEPKVINPEVLKPQSTFTVTSIKIDKEGKLQFTTTGESGSLPFIVEQFRWNKWIKIGTIEGKGHPEASTYSIEVNLHSGYNRFRVKQIDYTRKPRYGKELKHKSMLAEASYSYSKSTSELVFSAPTMYELYNDKGSLIDKGIANKVSMATMPAGDYYVNYDTKTDIFKKK